MNKRVVLLTNSYSGGGAENSMSLLHQSFLDSGVESFLLCLNQSELQDSPVNKPGVIMLNRGWGDGILGTFKNFLEFNRVVNSLDARILVGNCELPELYLSLMNLKKYKVYCVEHTSNPWFGRRALGYLVRNALAFKKVSWITVSSEAGAIWPTSAIALHIPNPIANPTSVKKATRELRLAFVGRLRAEKRPDWALTVSKISGVPIDFYGDGPMEKELLAYVHTHKVNAVFHGYTPGVWDQISENTIVITPSEFEGDGLTVVEAIVRGIPILLADNADLRRFGLSPRCYFSTALEMAKAIEDTSIEKLNCFTPSKVLIENYLVSRSLDTITKAWKKTLGLD